jgi:glucokinase
MIGLELTDLGAIALVVDGDGRVRARAEATSASGSGDAAVNALAQLPASNGQELGVAAAMPESDATTGALAGLDRSGRGPAAHPVVASGTAAAVAEAWVGAARSAADVVFFSSAEHTTAGILRRGAPVTGSRGRAPAVAWLALNPVEREDYRKTGCLEAEAAAAGIVRRLIWRVKAGDHSKVQELANGDLSAITLDHVLDAARERDGVAISVVRDTAKYLGMAAANLVVLTDPEVLVVGGIMATAADVFLEPLRTEIARRLPREMMQALTLTPAALGADAAAIGAARLAAAAARR